MKSLIFGSSGQDGFYLAQHLERLSYDTVVIGADITPSDHLDSFMMCDIQNRDAVFSAVETFLPDEIYHLAALTSVPESWRRTDRYFRVNAIGTLHVLEAVHELHPSCKVFVAISSDIYGAAPPPQNEKTPSRPLNPYAASKAAAHQLAVQWRLAFGLFVCCGILFPHSSPRQAGGVLKKIAADAAAIADGRQEFMLLGNDTIRDFAHASDTVRSYPLMLHRDIPDDYVVGSGYERSIHDVGRLALQMVGADPKTCLRTQYSEFRPTDAPALVSDPSKIMALGWKPKIPFETLLWELIEAARQVPVVT